MNYKQIIAYLFNREKLHPIDTLPWNDMRQETAPQAVFPVRFRALCFKRMNYRAFLVSCRLSQHAFLPMIRPITSTAGRSSDKQTVKIELVHKMQQLPRSIWRILQSAAMCIFCTFQGLTQLSATSCAFIAQVQATRDPAANKSVSVLAHSGWH